MGVRLLREYLKLVLEMPHLELDGYATVLPPGHNASLIDFRIERLGVGPEEKRRLMLAFRQGGFVGSLGGQDFVFSADVAVRPAGGGDEGLPRLPDGWVENAVFLDA